MIQSGPVFLPKGFKFAAVKAGIKASGNPDLALIIAEPKTSAAALFTRNLVTAAPVEVGRAALSKTEGRIQAAIVNSGNANCATGQPGVRDCKKVCAETARLLNMRVAEVFPSSTGIIGVPLPVDKIISHLKSLVANAGSSLEHLQKFSEAILTTDSKPKLASVPLRSGRGAVTGVAKGAGMIHPQLATMLVYLLTDVAGKPAELKTALRKACDESFNAMSIDGDTSTNDTVLLLASGASGIPYQSIRNEFDRALQEVCRSLAEQIVSDGEGVRHVVRLRIDQARTRTEALQIARAISHSLLVKTAWAGADPNWGRILAAVGRSGVPVNPKKVFISIGKQVVCRRGMARVFDEKAAHQELSKAECEIGVRVGRGKASLLFLTTDLTQDYVKINADYST
ncbi:MAG TPA: bifunctional glutamate N-acetyltransferase/amino-acid acetyltransferase ArgJ [Terriglobales bacterium]|jgi:glutamate N-acetyltransferase / amino-acid N-acetyltransferase|nr:bifunctional glutamate N-acetyltransferase/amino-acid acetyltransferase ArgJ [Terriglobales bacterium]